MSSSPPPVAARTVTSSNLQYIYSDEPRTVVAALAWRQTIYRRPWMMEVSRWKNEGRSRKQKVKESDSCRESQCHRVLPTFSTRYPSASRTFFTQDLLPKAYYPFRSSRKRWGSTRLRFRFSIYTPGYYKDIKDIADSSRLYWKEAFATITDIFGNDKRTLCRQQSNTNVRLIRTLCLRHKRDLPLFKSLLNWDVLTCFSKATTNFERSKVQITYPDLTAIVSRKISNPAHIAHELAARHGLHTGHLDRGFKREEGGKNRE